MSILTNNSAMVALQTLKSINTNLGQTQNAISTGKEISSARDNSAVWAISKVMGSDVQGFKAISSSLALGEATVAVARNAAETITDLLTQMKEKIVAAQGDNVDRSKINNDVTALKGQVESVVAAAQFNGLNLVNGTATSTNILSSLDRDAAGSVTASSITVNGQNLSTGGYVAAAVFNAAGTQGETAGRDRFSFSLNQSGAAGAVSIAANDAATQAGAAVVTALANQALADQALVDATAGGVAGTITTANQAVTDANTAVADANEAHTTATQAAAAAVPLYVGHFQVESGAFSAGDSISIRLGDVEVSYTITASDIAATTAEDVIAIGLKSAIEASGANVSVNFNAANPGRLEITNTDTANGLVISGQFSNVGAGGLGAMSAIDVSTGTGATAALASIESLIGTAIGAAAAFGSSEGRIASQATFISNLTDSLRTGIGAMVDANMEAASARLQALQVQQQLAVQSLSIANQAPQTILSLFR